ncbi:MAG: peptidoglycan DD-metalloendopeptidase family protein [Firmicutes bacterium]|nr:peptidoglycan DD-metalloendopeptidase family protein [Bacillota bacterium]
MESHSNLGRIKKTIITIALILTIVIGTIATMPVTVYSGTGDYWKLTVDGKFVAYLKSEEDAEYIIKAIKEEYVPADTEDESITEVQILPEVEYEKVTYKKYDDHIEVPKTLTEVVENVKDQFDIKVVVKKEFEGETSIPFETIIEEDPDMYVDEEPIVKVEGEKGLISIKREVTEINGVIQGVRDLASREVEPAISRVVVKGTKERPTLVVENGVVSYTGEESYYIWPYNGMVTSYFGYRNDAPGTTNHKGIDINASYGSPVVAARAGVVTSSTGWTDGYGYTVYIDHGDGMVSLYAHNSSLAVSAGEEVEAGDVISYAGSTGWSSGTHVHFETRYEGTPINPLNFLP